jgi:hypothetical protein
VPRQVDLTRSAAGRRDLVSLLILNYAVVHVGLGGWQLISPGTFFTALGPFGESNAHYTRDVGTFTLALGVAFAVAYRWPAWRPGVVGYALFQYVFHTINHLADIGDAHPKWVGPSDFAALLLTAAVLGWLLKQVLSERTAAEP